MPPRLGRPRALTALVAAPLLVVTACAQGPASSDASSPPPSSSSTPGAVPAGLERFYDQELVFEPCDSYATTATEAAQYATSDAFECSRLEVPVDYSEPDGDVMQIALMRAPARGEPIGSLVLNTGGPGGSGLLATAYTSQGLASSPITERFDLVGFDPRGVGRSTPAVWCNSDEDNDRLRADPQVDYSPEGIEHIEDETKAFVERCVDKMGEEFLANVGTVSVAKDLDAMREAMGDEKLTYLGYSYGTRIGAAYAEE